MFESTSIVSLNTLMEPFLFREMVNFKALSELRVGGSVDLSDEHLLVHIFQCLSSLFVLRVRLVCVEVNEHELMFFQHRIKIFSVQMHHIRIFLVRSDIYSSVRVSGINVIVRVLLLVLLFLLSSIRSFRVNSMVLL